MCLSVCLSVCLPACLPVFLSSLSVRTSVRLSVRLSVCARMYLVPREMLPSRRKFCVHHSTMHQFTVSLIQSHVGRVYVCLAVTCHPHFWQNGRDLLRATAIIREWNGYRNKSQHRKLTLEKKIIPSLLPGLEPGTFRSRVRRSNR